MLGGLRHGSGFYKDGINFEGPTPRPLERARIFLDPDDGQIVGFGVYFIRLEQRGKANVQKLLILE